MPSSWSRPRAEDIPAHWQIPPAHAFTSERQLGEQIIDDLGEFWARAQFGYTPSGERVLSGSRLEYAYSLCDRLARGDEPPDAVVVGASLVPTDVAIARILNGYFAGGGMLGTPRMMPLHYFPEPDLVKLLAGIFFVPSRIEV